MRTQNDIEIVRALLCCLSFEDSNSARPVHINSIGALLQSRAPWASAPDLCNLMAELQEVSKLPNGFVYPAPLRQLPWKGCTIIVGPHSTWELQRSIDKRISLAGFGRVFVGEPNSRLATQSIDDWMNRPPNLVEWGRNAMVASAQRLKPTIHAAGSIEVYFPKAPVRWVALDRSAAIPDGNYLCRRQLSEFDRRYFLGLVHSNSLLREAEMDFDSIDRVRLRYAIDAIYGIGSGYRCRFRPETVILEFAYSLPAAERRLLIALGTTEDPSSHRPNYEMPKQFLLPVEEELKKIGLTRGVQRQ